MEKRSPRSPLLCEDNQLGCMWGLISVFDFRHDRLKQKLISNGRPVDNHESGPEIRPNVLTNSSKNCQGIDDGADEATFTVKPQAKSVKKFMEEEMLAELHLQKQINTAELQQLDSYSGLVGLLPEHHRKTHESCKESSHVFSHDWRNTASLRLHQPSKLNSMQISPNNLSMGAMLEAFCTQIHCENEELSCDVQSRKDDHFGLINQHLVQMTAEAFIDQMFVDKKYLSKDAANQQSEQILDALEILNMNKELFVKLLQDPNSLLARHIQNLRDSQAGKEMPVSCLKAKLTDRGVGDSRHCEKPLRTIKIRKQNMSTLFWKKVKAQHEYSSKGRDCAWNSNRIVVLKPGPKSMQKSENTNCHGSSLQSHHSMVNQDKIGKRNIFSFGGIKRKLKQAIWENLKEQHMDSDKDNVPCNNRVSKGGSKGICQEVDTITTAKSSTDSKRVEDRNMSREFKLEIRPDVATISESACEKLAPSTVGVSKRRENYISKEAKRHLHERLKNIDSGDNSSSKQARTLRRVLSSPENDILLPPSSGTKIENGSFSAQMRFSPCNNLDIPTESSSVPRKEMNSSTYHNEDIPVFSDNKRLNDQIQTTHSEPKIMNKSYPDFELHENVCSIGHDLNPNGYEKIVEPDIVIQPGEANPVEVMRSEPTCIQAIHSRGSMDMDELDLENECLDCSGMDSPLKNQTGKSSLNSSLSTSLSIKDIEGHQSPVSILEPFFKDDITSPNKTIRRPDEPPMKLGFEEVPDVVCSLVSEINSSSCLNEKDLISVYVRILLQASGLDWDELLLQRDSYECLLSPSLSERVDLLPTQTFCVPELLFDCIKEVLSELYQHHCGCLPWTFLLEHKALRRSLEENVVDELLKEVSWQHFLQTVPSSLELLVGKDMAKSRGWIDFRLDAEEIVAHIADDFLEESILEMVLDIHVSGP